MFFILSKIFFYLLMPISFLVYGLVAALVVKSPRRKRIAVVLTLAWLFIASNEFIANELATAWEYAPVELAPEETYDVAVVLTGGIADKKGQKVFFGNSSDRIIQPLFLYKAGKVKKILISGGSGRLTAQADSAMEGQAAAELLKISGVPASDIILEGTSKNTRENAVNTASVLKNTNQRILLITSAYHMRRSAACFEKAGLKFKAYPVDFYGGDRQTSFDHMLIPKESALLCTYRFSREILGYIVYKLQGYA